MKMILVWPVIGAVLIGVSGIVLALKPEVARRRARTLRESPLISSVTDRFADQRDHLVAGVGPTLAFVLLVSVSLPPIVLICFGAGMLVTHAPAWAYNVSLYQWFMREGPQVQSFLRVLRGVSWLGEWRPVLVISGVAALGLFLLAPKRKWLAPALVATVLLIERDVQLTIGWFVHQPQPPTTSAAFPSGGVARVIAVYGFVAYLYLRLRSRRSWPSSVFVWTMIALFAFFIGYARAALLLHWPFDVPGGWLLGVLLLAATITASTVFDGSFFPSRSTSPRQRANE